MMTVDLRVENRHIIDGTGSPWFKGSVKVDDGTIISVARGNAGEHEDAEYVVEADGSVVCPGFIDTHSHSDLELFADPTLKPKIHQGITTEVLGQDGFSMAPLREGSNVDIWQRHLSGLTGRFEGEWNWCSVGEYFDAIEANGVATDIATLEPYPPRARIIGLADKINDDAIVLSGRKRSAIESTLFGSVVQTITQNTTRPVVIIDPAG